MRYVSLVISPTFLPCRSLYAAASFAMVVVFPTPVGPTSAMVSGRPLSLGPALPIAPVTGMRAATCLSTACRTMSALTSSAWVNSSRTWPMIRSQISGTTWASWSLRYCANSGSGIPPMATTALPLGATVAAVWREHCRTCPTSLLMAASSDWSEATACAPSGARVALVARVGRVWGLLGAAGASAGRRGAMSLTLTGRVVMSGPSAGSKRGAGGGSAMAVPPDPSEGNAPGVNPPPAALTGLEALIDGPRADTWSAAVISMICLPPIPMTAPTLYERVWRITASLPRSFLTSARAWAIEGARNVLRFMVAIRGCLLGPILGPAKRRQCNDSPRCQPVRYRPTRGISINSLLTSRLSALDEDLGRSFLNAEGAEGKKRD